MSGIDSYHSWVVAVASSVIFLLVSCPVRLGAQIFVSLLDRYDTSRKEASLPFVLAMVVRSISGPFAGALGEIIGLQGVTVLGCLICAFGIGLCFFAEDILIISVCFGVVNGIGYGWSNALIPEILNRHFKKHRSKAYGVFLSGGGLGSLFIPPLLEFILKEFGVSGSFLILSAIMLNSVPAAFLLTVPKCEKKQTNSLPILASKVSSKTAIETTFSANRNNDDINRITVNEHTEVGNCALYSMDSYETRNENSKNHSKTEKIGLAFENHTTNINPTNRNVNEENKQITTYEPNSSLDNSHANTNLNEETKQITTYGLGSSLDSYRANKNPNEKTKEISTNELSSSLDFNDTGRTLSGETTHISTHKIDYFQSSNIKQEDLNNCAIASGNATKLNSKENNIFSPRNSFFFKFSILWSPEYLIITTLTGLNTFINQVLWTIMVDFSRDKGIEKSLEVYFVMFLSLFDTIGRLTLGIIIDKGLMTIANFTSCLFVVTGFIFLLLTRLPEFFSLISMISLLGFIFGGITIALPGAITEFIMKEKRPIAMASRLLFSAPLCLTISPSIGYFRGSLGSYDGLLYLMTSMCVFCVFLLLLLPVLKKRRKNVNINDAK